MNYYQIGQSPSLVTVFSTQAQPYNQTITTIATKQVLTFNGIPIDPAAILLKLRDGNGVERVYTYGTDALIQRDQLGVYYARPVLTVMGRYHYHWEGDPASTIPKIGFDIEFMVVPSVLV